MHVRDTAQAALPRRSDELAQLAERQLDHVDALYLTIVTISTVGYGDYTPSLACIDDDGNEIFGSTSRCVGLRVFTIFYILIGVAFIFSQLANLFAGQLETFSQFVKRQIDRLDTTEAEIDTTGDGKADTNVAGRSVGLSGRGRNAALVASSVSSTSGYTRASAPVSRISSANANRLLS